MVSVCWSCFSKAWNFLSLYPFSSCFFAHYPDQGLGVRLRSREGGGFFPIRQWSAGRRLAMRDRVALAFK